ncbi:MAG TPA: GNAT family N-acetyltransferase [Abditibacteriaceae bacterium]|jgi:RimJ/RimL family protein N-acetyltransferase
MSDSPANHLKITTPRLTLIAATPEMVGAEMHDRALLSSLLGAGVPANWPPGFNDLETMTYTLRQLEGRPEQIGWWMWYFIKRGAEGETKSESILIGNGGFKGQLDNQGCAEVGYSVLPEFQRQGYGSEALAALVKWAFTQGAQSVIAETLPELVASIGLLEKNGFVFVGEGSEEGVIRYQKKKDGE